MSGCSEQPGGMRIFEMGSGTGLNAFLTAIEQFPLATKEVNALNSPAQLDHRPLFQTIHECNWGEDVMISEFFTLRKENTSLLNYTTVQHFNLIYYDAFDPNAQPELWTKGVFPLKGRFRSEKFLFFSFS